MATTTFYNKDVEKYTDFNTFDSFISEIGMSLEDKDSNKRIIDITPNRPDLLYFYNFIREFKLHKNIVKPHSYIIENKPIGDLYVSNEFNQIRPYSIAFAVKGLNFKEHDLEYLINFSDKLTDTYGRKRKKIALGIHNLDMVKFPIFYVLSENKEFEPLRFDGKIKFSDFVNNDDFKGYSDIVKNESEKYPILKDTEKILSFVPVINSAKTSIDENTKNILIDINGTDKTAVLNAAKMISSSLMDIGCSIYPIKVHMTNRENSFSILEIEDKSIKVSSLDFNKIIGLNLNFDECVELIEKSGYFISKYKQPNIYPIIPPYRTDVFSENDIIEDMAISYGYKNIESKDIKEASNAGRPNKIQIYKNKIAEFSVGLGYTEASNFYLTNKEIEFEKVGRPYSKPIELMNSKTNSFTIVRVSLLPSLIENLSISSNLSMPQKLFEVGSVFELNGDMVNETIHLAMVNEGPKVNFNLIKSDLDALFRYLKMDYKLKESEDPAFIEGRRADVYFESKKIGVIGEISPQVLENFSLSEPLIALELELKQVNYNYK